MNVEKAMSRTWMEIHEDAVLHNYHLAHSLCHQGVTLISVLKANAYGHGLKRIGALLWQEGARVFAVAAADEGLSLRQELPEAEILVMGIAGESQLPELIEKNITLTAGTLKDAQEISKAAVQLGKAALVQIKIDTGLHRLGFESVDEVETAVKLPGLDVRGLYSHLALRSDEQSKEQYTLFVKMEEDLKARGICFAQRHLLDSIGLTRYDNWQMTGVRIGAFLYGNVPPQWDRYAESRETVRFCTRVTRVAWVKAGEGIGYDEEPIEKDTRVATLSCGYVDGYSRQLSGVGEVEICGKRARVLGIVCMDQMMVDVTDIPEVKEGDTAVLFGGSVTLREYAAWGSLNRNECMAVIGPRVPRVYFRNGAPVCVIKEFQG